MSKMILKNLIRGSNNVISSKDTYQELAMHSKSDNIDVQINDKADGNIEELSQSLRS